MDGDTIKKFIDKLFVYFALCVVNKTCARAEFTVTLLSGSTYTWYTTQYYAIGAEHANRLIWECLKSNLQSYFKPLDYAYQTQVALLYWKQAGHIASYIRVFLQYLNNCSDVEETEAIFHLVEGLVFKVKCYAWLQQLRALQHMVQLVE